VYLVPASRYQIHTIMTEPLSEATPVTLVTAECQTGPATRAAKATLLNDGSVPGPGYTRS
jgi:hypothetical protein